MRHLRLSGLLVACLFIVVVAMVATTVSSRQLSELNWGLSTDEVDLLELPLSMAGPIALLREGDDPLPGAPGEVVSSLSNPVVNHVGGYGITVNTTGSGTTLSNVWGNASGGPGGVIITEGTYGDLEQTSFESFHGLSDAGVPAYSATSNDLISGETGLDGAWLGTAVVLNELEPVASLPGQFSTFNSRPGVTALGQPYWIGGIADSQGSSTQNRVLFYGVGSTPVLMGGDSIVGVPEPVDTGSSNIDFDYRYSAFGTNYLAPVNLDAPTTSDGLVVSNGAAILVAGAIVREGSPVPALAGGLPGENWDNFDFMGVNEDGLHFFTGDTDAATAVDEFVVQGQQIILREGDVLITVDGMYTIDGAIEGGFMNEQGDWAVIWDADDPLGENIEVLIFNGEIVLKEGDEVDIDGDGLPDVDAILVDFTGISTLVVGDRQDDGVASVCFTADVDTKGTSTTSDDTEVFYCMQFTFAVPDDEDEDGDEYDDSTIGIGDEVVIDEDASGSSGSVLPELAGKSSALQASVYSATSVERPDAGTRGSAHRGIVRARTVAGESTSLQARLVKARAQVLRQGLAGGGSALRREVEALLAEAEETGQEGTIEMAENVLRLLYDCVER